MKLKMPRIKIPFGKIPFGKIRMAFGKLRMPFGKLRSGKTPLAEIPVGKVPARKIPFVEIPLAKVPPGKPPLGKPPLGKPPLEKLPSLGKIPLGKIPLDAAFGQSFMRRVAVGFLVLAALGLAASVMVTVWPQVLWAWPAIGADTAFALMRLLPMAAACLGLLGGVLCLAFARAPVAPPVGQPMAGDVPAPSGLAEVVRELQTVLAGEQSKALAFQEICDANGREAKTMSAHVARLTEVSREAEIRLSACVERVTTVLRQPGSVGIIAEAAQRPEPLPMDVSDMILRRITEQTRVIGMTLDGAVARMAAETESSVHSFRAAVIDATTHITALGETAVVLRRDVIALDTAGREIATAGATVISRVGGAVAAVDAALIYLPAAAAAVTSAAEISGQTLAEAAAALSGDIKAILGCARETRQVAELLQQEAATVETTKQDIANAGHLAIAAVVESVETAAARLVTAITDAEAEAARQRSGTLGELTATLETVAATLVDGAASAAEEAAVLRAEGAASGREIRQAAEMVQREVAALGAARQEIADAGASAGRAMETAAELLAAGGALQSSANAAELNSTLDKVASRLVNAAASVTEASDVLCADGLASGREVRQAVEFLQREAAAMGAVKQEIADASASAGRVVETAAARLEVVIADTNGARQGSADVTATLEKAANMLLHAATSVAQASGLLCADGAASGHEIRQAVELLQREAAAMGDARQEIADASASVGRTVETAAVRLAAVVAGADGAWQGSANMAATLETAAATLVTAALGVTKASDALRADSAVSGRETREAAEMLRREAAEMLRREAAEILQREAAATGAAKQEIANAGILAAQTVETAAARLAAVLSDAEFASHDSAGMAELMATLDKAAASMTNAAANVTDASGVLCAEGAAMEASGRDTRQAAEMLQRTAAVLATAGSGSDAFASVLQTLETTASQLAAVIADADHARPVPDHAGALETATATLVHTAAGLASAGQRVAAAGECAADQFAANIASVQAVLAALPEVRAELTEAATDLRLETVVLTAAAQQMAAAGTAATSAVSEVAVRAEIAATSLETAGRAMNASSTEAASQIERLGGVARQAEAQISRLPGVTVEISATAERLRDMTEVSDKLRGILPEAAARLEAAAPALDRLGVLSQRLENAIAGLPAAPAREESVMTLISLSADIGEAVLRVEAALSAHDGVWPAVAASMAQVEAAAAALARASADPVSIASANGDGTPAALAATLRRLDDVAAQTEMLLQQTEALAEAVIEGRAPGLAVLLADRTPVLLAGIDSMTRRMRSVATALALVNDGVPALEQGSRRAG